jgi:hypothetical protein
MDGDALPSAARRPTWSIARGQFSCTVDDAIMLQSRDVGGRAETAVDFSLNDSRRSTRSIRFGDRAFSAPDPKQISTLTLGGIGTRSDNEQTRVDYEPVMQTRCFA